MNMWISLIYYFMLPVTLLYIIYLYSNYKLSYWKRKGIQQLCNPNILFGHFKNAALLRTPPGYHFAALYSQAPSNVPYVGFYMFHRPCLLLKDSEIIKQILIRDFNIFKNRCFAGPQQKDSQGMRNLFGLRNFAWRYSRQKISPTFTRSKRKQIFPLMMDTVEPMMNYLNNTFNKDEPKQIDAQNINFKYTADLIANIALGVKTDSFTYPDSDYTKYFMRFFHSWKRMISIFVVFFCPKFIRSGYEYLIYFDASFIRRIFWNSIEAREKSGNRRGDYIDTIIDLKNGHQDPVYQFTGDNLFFQSGIFFGLESSSTTSSFALMALAKNKLCQDRARDDIKDAIEKHGWTMDAYNEMKYLDQCIFETLRMHPPIPMIDRYTLQDYNIPNSDVCIKEGTSIYISLYGLHRDPKYFDEPNIFNPERFAKGRTIPDIYMPFGIGPRKCVGLPVGMLHVRIVLSKILSEFEISQNADAELKLDTRFTFTSALNGVNIQFKKLSN